MSNENMDPDYRRAIMELFRKYPPSIVGVLDKYLSKVYDDGQGSYAICSHDIKVLLDYVDALQKEIATLEATIARLKPAGKITKSREV
jgi:hypothetical protein